MKGSFAVGLACWLACQLALAASGPAFERLTARTGVATQPQSLPEYPYPALGACYVLMFVVNSLTLLSDPTGARKGREACAAYLALLEACTYGLYTWAPSMPCFVTPWGARVVPTRYVSWCFTNPAVLSRIESLHAVSIAAGGGAISAPRDGRGLRANPFGWRSAVAANALMVATGFAGLFALSCGGVTPAGGGDSSDSVDSGGGGGGGFVSARTSLVAGFVLVNASNAAFIHLIAAMRSWFGAAVAGSQHRATLRVLAAFSFSAWCAFPCISAAEWLLAGRVTAAAFEGLWCASEVCAKIMWVINVDRLFDAAMIAVRSRLATEHFYFYFLRFSSPDSLTSNVATRLPRACSRPSWPPRRAWPPSSPRRRPRAASWRTCRTRRAAVFFFCVFSHSPLHAAPRAIRSAPR